jgi:hypothetical protein
MWKFSTFLFGALAVTACGGSQGAAQSPESSSSDSGAPADSASNEKPTMESQREPFVQTCLKKARAQEYCECAFEQFAVVFKDADLTASIGDDDPRLKELQKKTVANCSDKVDEKQVEANFLEGCIDGEAKKRPYCECAWPALRKELEIADFLGDAETLRFYAAKKKMTVTCKGKYPVELAKSEFMVGCTKEKPNADKTCLCLWKKVSGRYKPEEIAAGTADLSAIPGLSDCK